MKALAAVFVGAGAFALAGAPPAAPEATTKLRAELTVRQEVRKPIGTKPGARGSFVATLTRQSTSTQLTWRLTFRNLTGPATRAHLHLGRRGKAGPVAFGLCSPCRSGATGLLFDLRPAFVRSLLAEGVYVNVHTKKNRTGEIRGQIRKVRT